MNKLDINNWKFFNLKDLFEIEKSKNIILEIAEEFKGKDIPYITRTEYDNGTNFFVEKKYFNIEKGNCITIGGEGANVYYQPFDFISGNNINKLYSKHLNENNALFIVTLLSMEKYRYSYNRPFNKNCILKSKIKLPVDQNEQPDWKYMEEYIKVLRERERDCWNCWTQKVNWKKYSQFR